jgi:hypothetical protein
MVSVEVEYTVEVVSGTDEVMLPLALMSEEGAALDEGGTLTETLPLGAEELTPPLGATLLTDDGGAVDEGTAELSVGSS